MVALPSLRSSSPLPSSRRASMPSVSVAPVGISCLTNAPASCLTILSVVSEMVMPLSSSKNAGFTVLLPDAR
jgi:hypothetical protein